MKSITLERLRLKESVRLLALAGLVGLGGCGGGGGGGDGAPPAPGPAGGAAVVSGMVGAAPAASGAGAASAGKAEALNDADVEVSLWVRTKDGEPDLVDRQSQRTNAAGGYELTVNDPQGKLANGGYLVVTVRKDGYSDYSRRFEFASLPQRLTVPTAELTPVVTAVASPGAGRALPSAVATRAHNGMFTFGILTLRDGTRKAMAGRDYLAAKATVGTTQLEINIPASSVQGVQTLRAQLQTFDASNANDARNFPGDYVSNQRDARGNNIRIVSLGFDYINISDADSGRNLGEVARAARGARKAAIDWANPTIIMRRLPTGSVENLLQDACDDPDKKPDIAVPDPTANCEALRKAYSDEAQKGLQVPIYTYDPNTGAWDLFGLGSLVTEDDVLLTYDYVRNKTGQSGVAAFRAYASKEHVYGPVYVRIYVSNESFQRQFWNLDYPLLFDQPRQFCVQGRMTRSDTGAGVPGQWLSFQDEDSVQTFSYGSGVTDANGYYRINVTLMQEASDANSDRRGNLHYFDSLGLSYETRATDVGEAPSCITTNILLTAPALATVRGRVVSETGAPKPNQWVWGSSAEGQYFSATTDSAGRFSAEVRRDTSYVVYIGNSVDPVGTFKADRTEVVLNDFRLANRAPEAWGNPASTSLRLRDNQTSVVTPVTLNGYDYDGDWPLTWQLRRGASCTASGSLTGGEQLAQSNGTNPVDRNLNDLTASNYSRTLDVSLTQGDHTLGLEVTDSKGKKSCAILGTVNVARAGENRAPVIYNASANLAVVEKGGRLILTGRAYDPDGNPLTGTWRLSDGIPGTDCLNAKLDNNTHTCSATAPNADTQITVTWTVSDGTLYSSREFRVQVGKPSDLNVRVQSGKL